jgi:hypothetical protein
VSSGGSSSQSSGGYRVQLPDNCSSIPIIIDQASRGGC